MRYRLAPAGHPGGTQDVLVQVHRQSRVGVQGGALVPCAPGLAVIDLEIASRTGGRSARPPGRTLCLHRTVQASPISDPIGLSPQWARQ